MPITLPPLTPWQPTAGSLHSAARLLGALRMLELDPVPNYLEWSLEIGREGLSTGRLPSGVEVQLNFERCALVAIPAAGEAALMPLEGASQAALLESLLAVLEAQGYRVAARANGRSTRTEAFLRALKERGHALLPERASLTGETPLPIDPRLAADYGRVLYAVFTAAARFRAGLNGPLTPIVVWPEHFDLSFLHFATAQATDQFPHRNFGFAPFDDRIERPYLYVYASPMPEGYQNLPLPAPARWHTEGWQGAIVPYDALVGASDPEALIERLFAAIAALLAPAPRVND